MKTAKSECDGIDIFSFPRHDSNKFILHKMSLNAKSLKNVKNIRMKIIPSLLILGKEGTLRKQNFSQPMFMKSHKIHILENIRYVNVEHLPVKCNSKHCASCSTFKKPCRTQCMC